MNGLHLIKFCSFLSPFRMGLTNPVRALGRSSLLSISLKRFMSVWHTALFHKLISASLFPCFARWTQSFLSARRPCVVYQNHKSRSFRVCRGVSQGSVLGPVLFYLFINTLLASLPSSVSCSLYADDLAIRSSPSILTAVEAIQRALFRSKRWSEYWCLSLNPRGSVPTKPTFSPISSYSTPASVSIQLQLFFGSSSTALFRFLNMYLRPNSSHVSRPFAVSLLPHGASLRSPSLFSVKLFFGLFSHMRHPDGFLF